MSHPTWVRGLKHEKTLQQRIINRVAPYVGAWIETHLRQKSSYADAVAPYVGAWIETKPRASNSG